jgi:alanyl aminopeptidase
MPFRHLLRLSAGTGAGASLLMALAAGCVPSNDITRAPPPAVTVKEGAALAPPPLPSGRLPPTVTPIRYAVALAIDPLRDRFTGDVAITVDLLEQTQAIVLHGRDLTISRAEVTADGQQISATASFRPGAGSKDTHDELVLSLARPVRAGRAEIQIAYSAPISNKLSGLYRVKAGSSFYAFTQLEPTDARRMMPCFDEPSYKVPFELKVTTPKGNIVVANTDEAERTVAEEGRSLTFRFAPTPPLPTYLFALAVGPLEIREAPAPAAGTAPAKIRLITIRGKTHLGDLVLDAAPALTAKLGEYFNRPYPYPKLDLVAVPEFGFGAMENAGLPSFREELILLDAKSAGSEARRTMATNVAHEISHHWFGNLVTVKWWDDLWLNEGFATWMERKIVDAVRPATDARLSALREKSVVMERDALGSAHAVRKPVSSSSEVEDVFDAVAYTKGAAVLEMLEAWIGPDTFREGIRSYIKSHEHGSATATDFFQALSAASGKDVWPIAATFLDQPGVPLVRAELTCEKGSAPKVKLAQEPYRGRSEASWKIPLCVDYEGADKAGPACGLLEGSAVEIALPTARCPRFIYPNAHEHGYFRFILPPAQMAALAGASKELETRSRIGLVANAWALVQSGDMGADALLDLFAGMRRERHRLVVEQVVGVMEGVSRALIDDDVRPAFRRYVASILLPLGKELSWDPRKGEGDEQRLLRKSVLSALSTFAEDPWITAEAAKHAEAYLKDPRAVDADIAVIALRASSRRAGNKRFLALSDRAHRLGAPDERIAALGALGSFADPVLLRRALDLMLNDQIKIQDSFYIFDAATLWSESRPLVLAWVKDHFAELKAKVPELLSTRFVGVVSAICDRAARDDAGRLFGGAKNDAESPDRALVQALEVADACIEVRSREALRVRKRLPPGPRP